MNVVDLDTLIAMKQTQRAKDYPVIGALATQLPPEREIELTTDPDRIIALAATLGGRSQRPVARLAATGADRHAVVLALAEEIDGLQQADRQRMAVYEAAARPYIEACRAAGIQRAPVASGARSHGRHRRAPLASRTHPGISRCRCSVKTTSICGS